MISFVIVFLSGVLIPVQTAANSRLRSTLGHVHLATLTSFCISALTLVLVSVARGLRPGLSPEQITSIPWWCWTGGIIALVTISSFVLLFKVLGQFQAMVLPVFGQLLFSIAIDHFGLFGMREIPFSISRFLAIVLVSLGIVLTSVLPEMSMTKGKRDSKSSQHLIIWQAIGVLTGCLIAAIGAIYARLGVLLSSPIQASTISFVIAAAAMLIFSIVAGGMTSMVAVVKKPRPWWKWSGGIIGAVAVFINAWLIPVVGAGTFSVLVLSGQMTSGLIMERFGLMGALQKRIQPAQLVGLALMIAGTILIRIN